MHGIWIYVETSKQVADEDRLKSSPIRMPPGSGSARTTGKAWRSDIRFLSNSSRLQKCYRHGIRK
jgi:hypothetical protein